MRLPDVFADVFVARDGDATTAGLEILAAVFTLILIVVGVACWRQHRKQKQTAARLEACEQHAAVNRNHLELLSADEERLGSVVGEIRQHITGAPADSRPPLKLVKGG